ncbi:M48 family metallopeptidase [Peribacillus sp. NPDC096379]|uniref:M48 family metallopeptidase n=1 Tax=Peribacillus sp. NPDC096379 TaxID=3364393 RepID=UPI0038163294
MLEERFRNDLVYRKENVYFIFTMIFSIMMYIFLAFSIIGIVIIGTLILLSLFVHGLSMAHIRRNGVRISERQFSGVYEKAELLAKEMDMKVPNMYVLESSGMLNAFATRFFGKNMVVIYSELFDLSEEGKEDELMFVLAHEFAHIKRRHVLVHMLVLPAMFMPLLGEAYMRACEYTCDRYAHFYVQNTEASKQALTMLAIGKKLAPKVNQDAFVNQIREESGFFAWLSEKLSTHPHLPKRLNALDNWSFPEEKELIKEKKATVILGISLSILLFAALSIAAGVSIAKAVSTLATSDFAAMFSDDYEMEEGYTPLMIAASENDTETMLSLLSDGADINETDDYGQSALHQAVSYENYEIAKLLLEKGATVDLVDSYDTTPLNFAAYMGNIKLVTLLLEYGADPTKKDLDGLSAIDYAKDSNNKELIELFNQ